MGRRSEKRKTGFTLVELMITLALLGLALAIGAEFFDFGQKSFGRGEEHFRAHQNVDLLTKFVQSQVGYATDVTTLDAAGVAAIPAVVSDDYNYLFVDAAGMVVLRNRSGSVYYPPPAIAENLEMSMTFASAGTGTGAGKVLDYTIREVETGYSIHSQTNIENLGRGQITAAASSVAVRYALPRGMPASPPTTNWPTAACCDYTR